MLVYMLINTVTERAYVGQTTVTLAERLRGHWESARKGTTTLNLAMQAWDDECFWDAVVLQHCYDQEQLDQAEAAWQKICNSCDPAVGYNSRQEKLTRKRPARGDSLTTTRSGSPIAGKSDEEAREWYREQGKKGGSSLTKEVSQSSPLYGLSAEERREYFREAGRRGAAKSRKLTQSL